MSLGFCEVLGSAVVSWDSAKSWDLLRCLGDLLRSMSWGSAAMSWGSAAVSWDSAKSWDLLKSLGDLLRSLGDLL